MALIDLREAVLDEAGNLRRQLAAALPALQDASQLLCIPHQQGLSPPPHRLAIHREDLLQHQDLEPRVVQVCHQEFVLHMLPVGRHHLKQLQPIIDVNPWLRIILVEREGRIAFVGGQNQLERGRRVHGRLGPHATGSAPAGDGKKLV